MSAIGTKWTFLFASHMSAFDPKRTSRGPFPVRPLPTAQVIAVTLHELATNAAKYGALSVANGQVSLNWSNEKDGRLRLSWAETSGPKVQKPTRKGFGGRIIEQMIVQQSGKARFDWRSDGLVCEITLQT
jgi:two-component sensor histidine kinase